MREGLVMDAQDIVSDVKDFVDFAVSASRTMRNDCTKVMEMAIAEISKLRAALTEAYRDGYMAALEKIAAERDAAVARAGGAEELLKRVKYYHEWVKDNCLLHIEANAQIGLYQMLNDMEAYFAAAQDAKPAHHSDAMEIQRG
jgi:uncharacterized protein YlxP (DUF503 family)